MTTSRISRTRLSLWLLAALVLLIGAVPAFAAAPKVSWQYPIDRSALSALPTASVQFDQPVTVAGNLVLTVTAGGAPATVNGVSTDGNITFTFDTSSVLVPAPAENTQIALSLATDNVTATADGSPFGAGPVAWSALYRSTVTAPTIVILDRANPADATFGARVVAGRAATEALLRSVYGAATVVQWATVGAGAAFDLDTTNWAAGDNVTPMPWSASLLAKVNAADLFIITNNIQVRDVYWNRWTGPGVQAYTKPILYGFANVGYSYGVGAPGYYPIDGRNDWSNPGYNIASSQRGNTAATFISPLLALNPTSTLFSGVTLNASNQVDIYNIAFSNPAADAGTGDYRWRVAKIATGGAYNPTLVPPNYTNNLFRLSGALAAMASAGSGDSALATYRPAGSTLGTAVAPGISSTAVHAGPRAFLALAKTDAMQYLTPAGQRIYRNMLTMLKPVPAQPVILSVTPGDGATVTTIIATVTMTFDRTVTGVDTAPLTLTLNGVPGAPITGATPNVDGTVWTWAVPANQRPIVSGALSLSVDTSGIAETALGLGLPSPSPYVWNCTFDASALLPLISAVSPANGSLTAKGIRTVSATFDRAVTGVGGLTLNGAALTTAPVVSAGNTVYTWTIPAGEIPNFVTSIAASLDTSAVIETASGMDLAFATATYDWSFDYDPAQWQTKIVLVSNTNVSDDHSAYVSFLRDVVYPVSEFPNGIEVEDIRGKYYGMSDALRDQLQAEADVVTILPFQTLWQLYSAGAVTPRWNRLAKPIVAHNADLVGYGAWGWTGYNNGEGNINSVTTLLSANPRALFPGSFTVTGAAATHPIMAGVDMTSDAPRAQYFHTTTTLYVPAGMSANDGGPGLGSVGLLPSSTFWGGLVYWPKDHFHGTYQPTAASKGEPVGYDVARGTDQPIPAGRVFMAMGPYLNAGGGYGALDVANFFGPAGARDNGAKQALRNAYRLLFDPATGPKIPPVVQPDQSSPAVGAQAGILPKIVVHFSKPITGVQPGDLLVNASAAGFPWWQSTSVVAIQGDPVTGPATDWQFDGPWTGPVSLTVPLDTFVNVAVGGTDTPVHSHITDPVTGLGVLPATWTWFYAWLPAPAAVPDKTWVLYE